MSRRKNYCVSVSAIGFDRLTRDLPRTYGSIRVGQAHWDHLINVALDAAGAAPAQLPN